MFNIESELFCERLSFVKSGAMQRAGEMYQKVCLEQTGASLVLRSFNQIAHTLAVLDEDGGEPFCVLFDPAPLLGALKRVEGELTIGFSDHHMEVSGPCDLRHACHPGEDFIGFSEPDADPVTINGGDDLSHAIQQAQGSVDKNAPNQRFAGVYLGDRHTEGTVCCVGANTTSLIEVEMTDTDEAEEFEGESILPAQALDQIRTILEGDKDVNLYLGEREASFVTEEAAVTTRLIADKYPNYKAIMPDSGQEVDMGADKFEDALRICQEYTESFSAVLLDLDGEQLVVSAADSESGAASVDMEVDTADMGRMRLKASADRMLEVVGGMEGRELTMIVPIEENPTRVGISGETEGVSGAVALMMLQPDEELNVDDEEEITHGDEVPAAV